MGGVRWYIELSIELRIEVELNLGFIQSAGPKNSKEFWYDWFVISDWHVVNPVSMTKILFAKKKNTNSSQWRQGFV